MTNYASASLLEGRRKASVVCVGGEFEQGKYYLIVGGIT
jgi:hypothetical protein